MLYPQMQPQVEREYKETRWKNANPFVQTVTLDNKRFVWQPGEEKSIDSTYDRAIHTVSGADENGHGGTIVGGLAPRLTNISKAPEQRAGLHWSLDPDLQARREAEAAAIVAQKDLETARTDAILAQAKADKAKAPAEQSASKSK